MTEKKKQALKVGQLGELVAADFLIAQGYKLLEQNVRYKTGEIDLVMQKPDKTLCFVEVKTTSCKKESWGSTSAMQQPVEQLHARKIAKLYTAIVWYLQEQGQAGVVWQLDAVVVLLDQETNQAHCKHFEHISLEN